MAIDSLTAERGRAFLTAVSDALSTVDESAVAAIADAVIECLLRHDQVVILGNGGSCATASHLATDLVLGAHAAGLPARVVGLHDSAPLVTALANDFGFPAAAAAFVETSMISGDVLLMFSGSGRSANLVNAASVALTRGVAPILVASTSAPPEFPAVTRVLVASDRYSVVEAVHSALAHLIADLFRERVQVGSPRCSVRSAAWVAE